MSIKKQAPQKAQDAIYINQNHDSLGLFFLLFWSLGWPNPKPNGESPSSASWVLGPQAEIAHTHSIFFFIFTSWFFFYFTEINETKETCVGPSTTSCQSQKQQSGDSRLDCRSGYARNDRDDRGPRFVLCGLVVPSYQGVHSDSPLVPCSDNSWGTCPVINRTG